MRSRFRRVLTPIPVVLMTCAIAFAQGGDPDRPNVVLIITDDVGYGDIGSYGAPDIRTPNIDGLAAEGVRFTDFYSNGPTCTPTRAGLMTGRYQQRVRMERPLGASGPTGLVVTGQSLPQLLKNNGYATALIGKWHLGSEPEFHPNAHGFDYFLGFMAGFIDYYTHINSTGDLDLFENRSLVDNPNYMTDLITDRSIQFVEENAGSPFFLEVAYNATHWPFQVPEEYSETERAAFLGPEDDPPPTREEYVAMMERADEGVGRILDALEAQDLTENTLVIFTNDNGGEWLSRNAPLYHRKETLWEGGIRIPTILRWPGHLPEGRTTGQVGITMDLTATILEATNTPVPQGLELEGIDLVPLVQEGTDPVERTLFWRTPFRRNQRAIRRGDWKLMDDASKLMLFNLAEDIGEREDLSQTRTDVVFELYNLLEEWADDVDAEADRRFPLPGGGGRGRGGRGGPE